MIPLPVQEVKASTPEASFFDPTGAFEDPVFEPAPTPPRIVVPTAPTPQFVAPPPQPQALDFSLGGADALGEGVDLIAAARRAAQASGAKASPLSGELKPQLKTGANRRFKLPFSFKKSAPRPKPMVFSGGKPVPEIKPAVAQGDSRRTLVLAGLALLVAVVGAVVTFNRMMNEPKPIKQSTTLETTVKPAKVSAAPEAAPGQTDQLAVTMPAPKSDAAQPLITDGILTGALPAKKTEASLASLVAEPAPSAEKAEMPPVEIGAQSLRDAAASGDPTAEFIVATRYLDGQNVQQDFTKYARIVRDAGIKPE